MEKSNDIAAGSSSKASILAIDDAKDVLLLLEFELSEEGYQVFTAESGTAGIEILNNEEIDLVLLDILMPEMSGPRVLREIKQNKKMKHIPVIMLSASDHSEDIVSALDLGADDFVSKPYVGQILLARIRTSLRLLEKTRALEKIALTDFLTGINNRRQYNALSNSVLSQCERSGTIFSAAIFDIDHFKQVNDTYGHDIGDFVLVHFATLLADFFRQYDVIGRIGGEEFAVCMPETPVEQAAIACDRFRLELFRSPVDVEVEGNSISLTLMVSIGVAEFNSGSNLELVMKKADKALYAAKESGRNKVCKYINEKA